MKKKILLSFLFVLFVVCVFAISVSAAPRNYQSYEVELVNGEKITAYQACDWDQWQGRIWVTDTMYSEAPVDTEGTYATIDWAQIKVLDFTNAWGHVYNATTGEYELKRGTNGSMHICKTSFTASNATKLEKVITGVGNKIVGPVFSSMPALKELVVDSALVEIGYNAFDKSTQLTTITFSGANNLTTIGQQAFLGCTSLTKVDFLSSVTHMGSLVFGNCSSLKTVEWPSALTTIPDSTFSGCTVLEFEIPSNITSIGSNAFKNCDAFVTVVVPDGVTNLGSYAFSSCDNLEEIVISENSLAANKLVGVAEYCPKLTSFRIPPLVTELGYDNFRGCSKLSEIIWPNNLQKISGGQNFSNTAFTSIALPNTLTYFAAGDNWGGCPLEEIRIGANLTSIGSNMFNLKTLKRVYISASVTSVGSNILGYSNSNDSSNNITFIFTGTIEQAKALQALVLAKTEGTNHAPNSSKLYDAVLVSASEFDVTAEPVGFHLVYGYNLCDAFYGGEHSEGVVINSCQFGCGRNCGKAELLENPQHNLNMQHIFGENGYFGAISIVESCSVCATKTVDESVAPIFEWKGYSACTFSENFSITQGYVVNSAAAEKYAEYQESFDFGVLATVNKTGAAITPKVGDDNVVSGVFVKDANDYLDIKVKGIPADQADTLIVFCIYVTDGENVYYLDNGKCDTTVLGKSYNDVK